MQADRWRRVKELYNAALEYDQASRAEFLESACADDPQLLHEVASLLGLTRAAREFLSRQQAAALFDAAPESRTALGQTLDVEVRSDPDLHRA